MKRIFQALFFLAFASAQAQTPVASYSFSGNANDALGNHAAVHSALLVADRFGQANNAFQFDGTQSYLLAPNAAALNSAATTVSFWVKPKAFPTNGEAYYWRPVVCRIIGIFWYHSVGNGRWPICSAMLRPALRNGFMTHLIPNTRSPGKSDTARFRYHNQISARLTRI